MAAVPVAHEAFLPRRPQRQRSACHPLPLPSRVSAYRLWGLRRSLGGGVDEIDPYAAMKTGTRKKEKKGWGCERSLEREL